MILFGQMQALIVLTIGLFLTLSAFVRGSHFVEKRLKQEPSHEQVALPNPTVTLTPTPKPTPELEVKHTYNPQVKSADTYQAPVPTLDPNPVENQNKPYVGEPIITSSPTCIPSPFIPPTYARPPVPLPSFKPLDNQADSLKEAQRKADQLAEDRQYEDELYKLEYQAIEAKFSRKIREAENSFASRGMWFSGIAKREIALIEIQKNQELERLKRKYGKE